MKKRAPTKREAEPVTLQVEAAAPATEDISNDGAAPPRGADLVITAIYVTSSPLN